MKIAGNLNIEDWKKLEKKLEINGYDFWDDAFCFFEKRMETRYLNPINCISRIEISFCTNILAT